MIIKEKLKIFFEYFHSLEISWQIYTLLAIYLSICVVSLWIDIRITWMLVIFLMITILFFSFKYKSFVRDITLMANQLSKDVSLSQEYAIYHAPIGVLIYDESNRISWVNPKMQEIMEVDDIIGQSLESIDPKLVPVLNQTSMDEWQEISLSHGYYRILHHAKYHAIYLYDITYDREMQEATDSTIVVMGSLLLDDYDDLLYAMDDEKSAKFESELISDLHHWADQYHIFLKPTDEDRFMLLLTKADLNILEKEKFQSFEMIRKSYEEKNIPLSMALGLAYTQEIKQDMILVSNQARSNLDLALGRGGDQVVVRAIEGKANFYGGNTSHTEKRSDIRVKLFFQALKSSVASADNVVIAGHRFPDTDSIGSALGIYQICQSWKKDARIIINKSELNHDITELLSDNYFKENYDQFFITHDHLNDFLKTKTLFILVDHHRPTLSEAEPYINDHDTVIIDHHRRSEDCLSNSVLSYLEPSASSASELVTEYFEFVEEGNSKVDDMIATALLSGIVVDTNQFSLRTGSRTFQAAAYLKAKGADSVKIQYLLKESLETITTRNRLIEKMELLDSGHAITLSDEETILDNVTAAQTADEMLGIDHVDASFVIYRRKADEVGISARSLGSVNVQTIMEALGGGGHLSNAATQITGKTLTEVKDQLIQVIKEREE